MNDKTRYRRVGKRERVLLNRLDKKVGSPHGFHYLIYMTSPEAVGNAILFKAKRECIEK